MFDGKYNQILDSTAVRFGVLAVGFAIWVGSAVSLIAAS